MSGQRQFVGYSAVGDHHRAGDSRGKDQDFVGWEAWEEDEEGQKLNIQIVANSEITIASSHPVIKLFQNQKKFQFV